MSDSVTQYVVILNDDQKFLKLLEILGQYQEKGSIIVFVEKQITADVLLKVRVKSRVLPHGMEEFFPTFDWILLLLMWHYGSTHAIVNYRIKLFFLLYFSLILFIFP